MFAAVALAILAALLPPAALGWGILRGRGPLGLAVGLALLWLGPLAVSWSIEPILAAMRAGWQDGAPHDWSALDQPGRKQLIDGIRTRLAHGKLIAGLPDIARGLAGAGMGLLLIGWAYRRWQVRRQPSVD